MQYYAQVIKGDEVFKPILFTSQLDISKLKKFKLLFDNLSKIKVGNSTHPIEFFVDFPKLFKKSIESKITNERITNINFKGNCFKGLDIFDTSKDNYTTVNLSPEFAIIFKDLNRRKSLIRVGHAPVGIKILEQNEEFDSLSASTFGTNCLHEDLRVIDGDHSLSKDYNLDVSIKFGNPYPFILLFDKFVKDIPDTYKKLFERLIDNSYNDWETRFFFCDNINKKIAEELCQLQTLIADQKEFLKKKELGQKASFSKKDLAILNSLLKKFKVSPETMNLLCGSFFIYKIKLTSNFKNRKVLLKNSIKGSLILTDLELNSSVNTNLASKLISLSVENLENGLSYFPFNKINKSSAENYNQSFNTLCSTPQIKVEKDNSFYQIAFDRSLLIQTDKEGNFECYLAVKYARHFTEDEGFLI